MNRELKLLLGGRALRSLSLGYLGVIAPLYLAQLHYSAVQVGLVFTAGAVGSMVLTFLVGVLADRFGRKRLLVILGLLTALGGLGFALGTNLYVLLAAAAAGSIGRGGGAGSGGAFGPYFPAEQPLIAEHAGDENRTRVFGALALVGTLSGAAGSVISMSPGLLQHWAGIDPLVVDRALFALTVLLGLGMVAVILPVTEKPRPPPRDAFALEPATRPVLLRFLITNGTNGLAVGFLGPVLVYWFHVRYGVTSTELGGMYLLANLVASPSNLLSGRLARRFGSVRTIVAARLVALTLLASIALMPTFWLAAALFLARTGVNTLSSPIRQSFLMGVIPERDRSTAAGFSNLPLQVLSSPGPTIAGSLMQSVWVGLPLELAAGLQAVNALLYYAFFKDIRPPEERTRTVETAK